MTICEVCNKKIEWMPLVYYKQNINVHVECIKKSRYYGNNTDDLKRD